MGIPLSKPLEDRQANVILLIQSRSIFLYLLQLAMLTLLALLLLAIMALIISVNPDLIEERELFVTKPIKFILWPLRLVVQHLQIHPPERGDCSDEQQSGTELVSSGFQRGSNAMDREFEAGWDILDDETECRALWNLYLVKGCRSIDFRSLLRPFCKRALRQDSFGHLRAHLSTLKSKSILGLDTSMDEAMNLKSHWKQIATARLMCMYEHFFDFYIQALPPLLH